MQRRPPAAIPPLALVIPHPRLPRRRSSLLSQVSDPHTPPNCNSPLPLLASSSNRKSSDSWNSSNYDGADDLEFEWTPEQMRLLSRVRTDRGIAITNNLTHRIAHISASLDARCCIRLWMPSLHTCLHPSMAPFLRQTFSIRLLEV